jgi:hypothetical protein
MKRKMISIVATLILLSTWYPFSGIIGAGDENNPEIIDGTGDTPFPFSDIHSAWFFENEVEPNYLYISLKFQSLWWKWRVERTVYWEFEGVSYTSYHKVWTIRNEDWLLIADDSFNDVTGIYDLETGVLTWKIPKSMIGDPQPGDLLTKLHAFGGFEPSYLIGGGLVLFRDDAPDTGFGSDYQIQY